MLESSEKIDFVISETSENQNSLDSDTFDQMEDKYFEQDESSDELLTSERKPLPLNDGEREFFKLLFMSAILNVPQFMLSDLCKLNVN